MHDSDTLLAALRDVVSVCGSVPKSFSGCLPGGPNTLWNPPLPETGWIGASTHPVTRIRIDLALKGMETK